MFRERIPTYKRAKLQVCKHTRAFCKTTVCMCTYLLYMRKSGKNACNLHTYIHIYIHTYTHAQCTDTSQPVGVCSIRCGHVCGRCKRYVQRFESNSATRATNNFCGGSFTRLHVIYIYIYIYIHIYIHTYIHTTYAHTHTCKRCSWRLITLVILTAVMIVHIYTSCTLCI